MRPRIILALPAHVAILSLAACTSFESEYEKGVYDYEPLYCYQTLGGVDCHRQPHHQDAARLVNYYGPAPSKYKQPKPPEEHRLRPPPKVSAAASETPQSRPSAESDAEDGGGPGDNSEPAAAEEKSEWKEWLPLLSVAFGALQVVAAFAL
jgi:hypothetical protein